MVNRLLVRARRNAKELIKDSDAQNDRRITMLEQQVRESNARYRNSTNDAFSSMFLEEVGFSLAFFIRISSQVVEFCGKEPQGENQRARSSSTYVDGSVKHLSQWGGILGIWFHRTSHWREWRQSSRRRRR